MPTHSPLVSIITPTFNHEKYIGPCIESVLKQNYQNWELIAIDDGSTDRTAEIIRGFVDPRIRYVHQENKGVEALAHTYNHALTICNGELIAILEGDDLWPPEKLSALTPAFSDADVVLAYGAVADTSSDGTWQGKFSRSVRKKMRLPRSLLLNDPPGAATRYMMQAEGVDLVPASTVVLRRSALNSIGGFQYSPGLIVTDFPTFLRLSLVGKFHYTSKVMGYRRRHLGSTTFQNMDRITRHAHEYVKHFLYEANFRLGAAERNAIEKTWNRPRSSQEFTAGRLQLLNGEWAVARAHFLRALNPSHPYILLAAFAGWCLSWFRCDLERLLALNGVARLERASSPIPSENEKRRRRVPMQERDGDR